MDSADEAKQEFPFVAVTTIGGNSPKWLKNFPGLDGKPDVEIVIARNARDKRTAASFEIEVPAPKAPARIFIIDETFSSQDFQFSDAIWIICAHARDLDTIAETCAWYAHYGVFRGRSLRDALRIGGGAGDRSRVGRGVAVSGICDENAVRSVKRALHKFGQLSP